MKIDFTISKLNSLNTYVWLNMKKEGKMAEIKWGSRLCGEH